MSKNIICLICRDTTMKDAYYHHISNRDDFSPSLQKILEEKGLNKGDTFYLCYKCEHGNIGEIYQRIKKSKVFSIRVNINDPDEEVEKKIAKLTRKIKKYRN